MMYSNKENILQLTSLLKAFGIQQIIVCPGSRNTPLIYSFAGDPYFNCYTLVDERSAGFFAIGQILKLKQPVVVCCTSGSAVLNLSPAIAEASLQELPLIVITADRPEAWIGQKDGQTFPQKGVFNSLVRKSVHINEPHSQEDLWYINRTINEALLSLNHPHKGPVHINVALSEPLFEFTVKELPDARVIKRIRPENSSWYTKPSEEAFFREALRTKKRMIIIGQEYATDRYQEVLDAFCQQYDGVILAEHHSNQHPQCLIKNFDALLATLPQEQQKAFAPELVMVFGGHITAKQLKKLIRSYPPLYCWHINDSGLIEDTFQSMTTLIEARPEQFLDFLNHITIGEEEEQKPYYTLWKQRSDALPAPEPAYSDLYAVGELFKKIPEHSVLHLANSSSIRYAQLFPLNKGIKICANRGINGIEGSMSTAAGYASVEIDELNVLLIGDLSFFYDLNALWNKHIHQNLRILLNNNGGGQIFGSLPGMNTSDMLDQHIAAKHCTHAGQWAESVGFIYLQASTKKEFDSCLPLLLDKQMQKPVLLEVCTSMEQNLSELRSYYDHLKTINI